MQVFNGNIEDLLSMLSGSSQESKNDLTGNSERGSGLETFKQFAVQYVAEHDELPENHQALQHIVNSSSIDDIEAFLRQNGDYCDDCMLKLYRSYAAGIPSEEAGEEDSGESCPSE